MTQLVGFDPSAVLNLGWRLANLNPLTAGVILLCSCVVFLLLNGGSNERKRRRLSGVTLPPGHDLDNYMQRLDQLHRR
ncbi:hypothetical protein A8B78_15465 [Jannaschia sp. EhC01]|nr:hypothetical protein A8B78_15465 [Jannaschia sp. EhC01]